MRNRIIQFQPQDRSRHALDRVSYTVKETTFKEILIELASEYNMSSKGLRDLLLQAHQIDTTEHPEQNPTIWFTVTSTTIDQYKAHRTEPTLAQLFGSSRCMSDVSQEDAIRKLTESSR